MMVETRDNPRWPVVEIVLLVFFPVPFTDAMPVIGALQPLYGRMPEWLQLGIIFVVAPFILLSSALLAFRAARAKRKVKAVACAICALAGALATVLATGIVAALGAGPKAVGFAVAGVLGAAAIVFVGNIKRKSNMSAGLLE
jgi:hypothetical protein